MVADMIADEMRGYAAATVDARWAAQVAALGATWRGSDAEYLGASRGLAGDAGPRGAIATAIETLHVLQHLVVLERLLPLPGTARPAAQSTAQEHAVPADERLLGKIRALLAKAESTEFAEEAEALSARAQELMAKYSIDHALLAAESGRTEEPGGRRIAVDNPYEAPKASLLQTVAQANRCRVVWSKELGLVTVIGFPADLDAVELLFTSLLVQANSAMLRAGAKRDAYGRSRTRAFRQSFLVSYAIRIGERLSEASGHAEQQAAAEQAARAAGGASAGGKDLVPFLAARHQAVDDAVDAMFGGTLTPAARSGPPTRRAGNPAGSPPTWQACTTTPRSSAPRRYGAPSPAAGDDPTAPRQAARRYRHRATRPRCRGGGSRPQSSGCPAWPSASADAWRHRCPAKPTP